MGILGTMDPNSRNQRWSRWTFKVIPGGTRLPLFGQIRQAAATFGRIRFGSASEMNVNQLAEPGTRRTMIIIQVRSEGHPVHDPMYVKWMTGEWNKWSERGFGPGTTCECTEAKLEAGDRQDGTPREQVIIMDASALPRVLKGRNNDR